MSRFFERAFEIVMRPDIIGTMLRAVRNSHDCALQITLFRETNSEEVRVPRQD